MGKRNGIGITKIMFGLSSAFLAIILIGFLESVAVAPNMKNSNYAFSDTSELIMFEQMLIENEIPYKRISSTTFSVEAEWKNEADNIYQAFLRETEDKSQA